MLIPDRENAAVLFLDLQAGILPDIRTVAPDVIARKAGVLARLAVLHGLPAYLSAVPPGGAFVPEVTSAFGGASPILRTQTSAMADGQLRPWLEGTGRRVCVLSGVASEIVVQRTALDLLRLGWRVHIAVDACGGIHSRTESAAWSRLTAEGASLTSVMTFAAELAGDFTTALGGQTLGLMYEAITAG